MNLIIYSIFLIIYYAVHSIMAMNRVKAWAYKSILPEKYYRLVFNIIAMVGLTAVVFFYFFVEKTNLINDNWLKWPGGLLIITGLVWLYKGAKGYDMDEFFGFYQLRNNAQPAFTQFNTDGLNAQVRHPLYFGSILIVWGLFLVFPNDVMLVTSVISTLYIFIGTLLEEKKLEQQFGDAYRLYRKHVPMLFPFRWGRNG